MREFFLTAALVSTFSLNAQTSITVGSACEDGNICSSTGEELLPSSTSNLATGIDEQPSGHTFMRVGDSVMATLRFGNLDCLTAGAGTTLKVDLSDTDLDVSYRPTANFTGGTFQAGIGTYEDKSTASGDETFDLVTVYGLNNSKELQANWNCTNADSGLRLVLNVSYPIK